MKPITIFLFPCILGVYANVAKLRPWIDSQMARKEFHTSSYIDDPTTAIDFRGKE